MLRTRAHSANPRRSGEIDAFCGELLTKTTVPIRKCGSAGEKTFRRYAKLVSDERRLKRTGSRCAPELSSVCHAHLRSDFHRAGGLPVGGGTGSRTIAGRPSNAHRAAVAAGGIPRSGFAGSRTGTIRRDSCSAAGRIRLRRFAVLDRQFAAVRTASPRSRLLRIRLFRNALRLLRRMLCPADGHPQQRGGDHRGT